MHAAYCMYCKYLESTSPFAVAFELDLVLAIEYLFRHAVGQIYSDFTINNHMYTAKCTMHIQAAYQVYWK